MQFYFIFDETRCFGCQGCAAACVNVNSTPEGVFWRWAHKLPPAPGRHDTIYLSTACNHCAEPPCVQACPANALEKRPEDGAVIHNQDRCLGCRYCQMACPYDAIKWDEINRTVSKCHSCYERRKTGREPACVETCFAGALQFIIAPESEFPPNSPGRRIHPAFVRLENVRPSLIIRDTGKKRADAAQSNTTNSGDCPEE